MRRGVAIEDIAALRHYEGIDDVQLERQIEGLRVGDSVKLTLVSESSPAVKETVRVRITRINGHEFRGKLASRPTCAHLSTVQFGSPLSFTAAHIHSVSSSEPRDEG